MELAKSHTCMQWVSDFSTQHSKHSNILAYSNISYVGGCKHEVESKKEKKYSL